MRNLTKKQQSMLKKEYQSRGVTDVERLPWTIYIAIYDINPHENFDANANRFLMDLHMDKVYS